MAIRLNKLVSKLLLKHNLKKYDDYMHLIYRPNGMVSPILTMKLVPSDILKGYENEIYLDCNLRNKITIPYINGFYI